MAAFSGRKWPHPQHPEAELDDDTLIEISGTLSSMTDEDVLYYLPRIMTAYLRKYLGNEEVPGTIDDLLSILNVESLLGSEETDTIGENDMSSMRGQGEYLAKQKTKTFGDLNQAEEHAIFDWLFYLASNKPENFFVFEDNMKFALQYWEKRSGQK